MCAQTLVLNYTSTPNTRGQPYNPHPYKFSPPQSKAEFFNIGNPECCQPPRLHHRMKQDSLVRALQMEQQLLRQQGIRGTCRRHRLAYRAQVARKMGVAQGGSGSSDGGHVHRSSLELASLSPLLLFQQSHAVARSSGPSAASSSARMPPTHVFTIEQTRL